MRSTRLSWLKESVFVLTALHALAWATLVAPGLSVLWIAGLKRPRDQVLASIPVTLALGYAAFFAVYYGDVRAKLAILLLMLATVVVVTTRGWNSWRQFRDEPAARAVGLAFTLSLGYLFFLYSADMGIGGWTSAYRFRPAIWSSDAQLPQIVAEGVYRQLPVRNVIGGGWHVSDRPPLLAGLMLLARPTWEPLLAVGDNQRLSFLFYQVLGLVACSSWVVPAWLLLARALRSARHATLGVMLLATNGFMAFNSVYTWPKMLAGALGLAAYLTFSRATAADSPRATMRGSILSGALAGMAMMSHGGVVFGIVPIFAPLLVSRSRARIATLAVVVLTALLVMLPWTVWQQIEDPPGNALVKFALAGTWGMGDEGKSVWATAREAHASLTLGDWLRMRGESLMTLAGLSHPRLIGWYLTGPMDFAGRLRAWDFLYLFPALGAANLGWIALGVSRGRLGSPHDAMRRTQTRWLVVGIAGVALASLVNFSVNINICQSYTAILLMVLGLYSAILTAPAWLRTAAIAANVIYFCTIWVWSPLMLTSVRWDVAAGGLLTAACLTLWMTQEKQEGGDAASANHRLS